MLQTTDVKYKLLKYILLILCCIALVVVCGRILDIIDRSSVELQQKEELKELIDSRSTGQIILDLISEVESGKENLAIIINQGDKTYNFGNLLHNKTIANPLTYFTTDKLKEFVKYEDMSRVESKKVLKTFNGDSTLSISEVEEGEVILVSQGSLDEVLLTLEDESDSFTIDKDQRYLQLPITDSDGDIIGYYFEEYSENTVYPVASYALYASDLLKELPPIKIGKE